MQFFVLVLLGTVETSAYSETSIIYHNWVSQFYGGLAG